MSELERISPVKEEDEEDEQEGHQIGENPHQFILIWTLRSRSDRVGTTGE